MTGPGDSNLTAMAIRSISGQSKSKAADDRNRSTIRLMKRPRRGICSVDSTPGPASERHWWSGTKWVMQRSGGEKLTKNRWEASHDHGFGKSNCRRGVRNGAVSAGQVVCCDLSPRVLRSMRTYY